MNTRTIVAAFVGAVLFALPTLALADASASIVSLFPSDTVGVGTPVSFTVLTSGFTNPAYKVVDSFPGGVTSININSQGNFSWTPNNSDLGSHAITVTVTDSQGNTASVSQSITVEQPTVTISGLLPGTSVQFGVPVSFSFSSVGFVGPQYSIADSFFYSSVNYSNTHADNTFQWTPLFQDAGIHTIAVTARDYQGHLASSSVQITVTGYPSVSIVSVPANHYAYVGVPTTFAATTTNITSPAYSVSDAFTSSLGTSTLAINPSGVVTWTPNSNDLGSHLFTVVAKDSNNNSYTTQLTLQVLPASAAPVVMPVPTTTSAPAPATTVQTGIKFGYTFKNWLTVGSSGADVTALQQLLTKLGFYSGPVTGYFGNLTKGGVQNFQTANGFESIGSVGPLTRAALSAK